MELIGAVDDGDFHVVMVGSGFGACAGVVDRLHDRHHVHGRGTAQLRTRQLQQVVDRPRRAVGFIDHLLGEAACRGRIVDVCQRLGQHRESTHRGLQLVADVGDEIGAHGLETGPLADIVDRRQRATIFEGDGLDGQHGSWRTDELDGLAAGVAADGTTHVALHSFLHQHRGMTRVAVRSGVLHPGLPRRIRQDDTDG